MEKYSPDPEPNAEQQSQTSFYQDVFGLNYTSEKIQALEEQQGYIEIEVPDIGATNDKLVELSAASEIRWVSHNPTQDKIPSSGQIRFIIVLDPFHKFLFIRQDSLKIYGSNQTQQK